jgi:hypothetical protein
MSTQYKRNKRNKKKQTRKRNVRPQRGIITRMNMPSGYPPSVTIRLRYSELLQFAASVPYKIDAWRGNSCFDPNYSGGGHQPHYFDQYSAIYAKYKVFASSMKVSIINVSATSAIKCILIPLTEVMTGTTWESYAELPAARESAIIPVASRYPAIVSGRRSTKQVLGLRPGQVNDEDYSAATSANPASIWYWNFVAMSTDWDTSLQYHATIKLTYDVTFYERIDVPVSYYSNLRTILARQEDRQKQLQMKEYQRAVKMSAGVSIDPRGVVAHKSTPDNSLVL